MSHRKPPLGDAQAPLPSPPQRWGGGEFTSPARGEGAALSSLEQAQDRACSSPTSGGGREGEVRQTTRAQNAGATLAQSLLSAAAVRSHAAQIMAHARRGELAHFTWHPERMGATADYVVDTIRSRHPDLRVPMHSRWRHFEAGGVDRFGGLVDAGIPGRTATARRGAQGRSQVSLSPWRGGTAQPIPAGAYERSRIAIDLVIPSVLLDAGAGPQWRYADAGSGQTLARSEGLGVASLALFASGRLSDDPAQPLRCDAAALRRCDAAALAQAFQVGPDNPLVGLEGRAQLLRSLGEAMRAAPAVFADPERPGSLRLGRLFDHWLAHAAAQDEAGSISVRADTLLSTLLRLLGPVWPGRLTLAGVNLGDCWHHPATSDGYMPFHKLTQWMSYSLIEPLQWGALQVRELDALTGLPEYRNGGLLLDLGLLQPRDAALASKPLTVDSEPVVEWRALTVALLDELADAVRARLGVSAAQFPLTQVIEGGAWFAGRRIAAERRAGGGPPLRIVSDGTVF
ncbi:conserved hypothetical protein [Thiomonas sp. X19]|uniref:DUF1688 family protein n=1 Tax=Thiomonas sp. X19 TaxID=1050370 RepID=UPI000B7072E6|nr:DUF1688 family protein [Thiomonas sp. X19]SCC92030.1 conserved hypothetical protein [Thiomonas sp. X19]